MKRKSILDHIRDIPFWILYLVYAPIFWIKDKWIYYTHERKILLDKIRSLECQLVRTERERDGYRSKVSNNAYYQSENERLRKILSSQGFSNKKIKQLLY